MIRRERLLSTFLHLAGIPSPSGHEEGVSAAIRARLAELGLAAQSDEAGNLLSHLDGRGEPIVLTAHMDTVVPCDTVTPVVRDGVVYSDGTSILGADDKAGVAIILEALAVLREDRIPHIPLEILFTVSEEVGLRGAKAFDTGRLRSRMAIGLDAGGPQGTIVNAAPSQDSLWAEVHGRAAHAGVEPEAGINAIRVAAQAIISMPLGRIDPETTSNIGVISGGRATNIVPDVVTLRGEARSRDRNKLERQTAAMVQALQQAAQTSGAVADVRVTRTYETYTLDERSPVVALLSRAMRGLGVDPLLVPSGGGSDANILNAAGLQTVQISAGMEDVHALGEHVALTDMETAARIVLGAVTVSGTAP